MQSSVGETHSTMKNSTCWLVGESTQEHSCAYLMVECHETYVFILFWLKDPYFVSKYCWKHYFGACQHLSGISDFLYV